MEFEIFKGGRDSLLRGKDGGTINLTVNNSLTAEIHFGPFEGIKSEAEARTLAKLICLFINQKSKKA